MRAASPRHPTSPNRHGFTLLELLIAIGVIALMLAILFPALARARNSSRAMVGLANLRQIAAISAQYASDFDHKSPALGYPWTALPFWALVVQDRARADTTAANPSYAGPSLLRDPLCAAHYGRDMERCYAANATGRAGLPGDLDNFDTDPVHIHLDRVRTPSELPWYLSSAIATATTNGPPPTRTAGALDLRNPVHLDQRLARFAPGGALLYTAFDGSASTARDLPAAWSTPLP